MKQHSYAFYTGWLSNVYFRQQRLQRELEETDFDDERERLIHEIEHAERDITGKILGKTKYPENLTFANFLDYMLCPTLVYELEYPRTDRYSLLY